MKNEYVSYDITTGEIVRQAGARYLKNIRQAAGHRVVSWGWYMKNINPRVCEERY